jgi:hypothetical protein
MKIEPKRIKVKDIVAGYKNNDEEGVFSYNGKLNIRPPYQREFIYGEKESKAVIDSVMKSFPLNTMYWCKNNDGTFEVLDGQQRTISICEYIEGNFSFENRYFHTLTNTEQKQILNYELTIYVCEGNDKEKLEWFKIINISGKELSDQELRNAVYRSNWLSDAKRYFSKNNCAAYSIGKDYLTGDVKRQDYLETAIKWISNNEIENYMDEQCKKRTTTAIEIWNYFQSVISWTKALFENLQQRYKKFMKGVEWGFLYNEYKNKSFNPKLIVKEVENLMLDEDVDSKKGIFYYIFDKRQKHLNLRNFNDNIKLQVYEQQKGKCKICKKHFEIEEMEADHIDPWHSGGKTTIENCQMLCKHCNRIKSGK